MSGMGHLCVRHVADKGEAGITVTDKAEDSAADQAGTMQ